MRWHDKSKEKTVIERLQGMRCIRFCNNKFKKMAQMGTKRSSIVEANGSTDPSTRFGDVLHIKKHNVGLQNTSHGRGGVAILC